MQNIRNQYIYIYIQLYNNLEIKLLFSRILSFYFLKREYTQNREDDCD